ncbi:hypothetical protein [Marinobacter nauticus]|uniref:Uncharacterized protein n=1 Tax=Marinobacter nauticus TaxID=2743 RepID=A0A368UUE9_MARNT|nr:hypothetical protein [Marinobacter nauticus]RBP71122.1 hypothetical protein DET64_109252 [Marinobacter nauticus]RCW32422.1 hypothetical protein DET51_109252 [Marinobacter nauticus]
MAETVAALQACRASSKLESICAEPILATVGLNDTAALQYIFWIFTCRQSPADDCFNSEHNALNSREALTVHSGNWLMFY